MDFSFTLKRLETWHGMAITITDALNTPIDLTDAIIEFNMKKSSSCSGGDPLYQATIENGKIIVDDPLAGKFIVQKTEFDLLPDTYIGQVKIILNGGDTIFPLTGTIQIEKSL